MNTFGGRKNNFTYFFALERSSSVGLGTRLCVDQRSNWSICPFFWAVPGVNRTYYWMSFGRSFYKGPSTTVTLRCHSKYSASRRIRTRDRSVRGPSDSAMLYVRQRGWAENINRRWSHAGRK